MTIGSTSDVKSLIGALDSAGTTPAEIRRAFEAVPREWFIPDRVWVQEGDEQPYSPVDRNTDPSKWRRFVYSNRVVVTQFDDGEVMWPDVGLRPTCSASMPSAVAGMLTELDVHPGHHVLEIGTGTGFNAALLGELVGVHGNVLTVEIDESLAKSAQASLRSTGYSHVRATQGDGEADHDVRPPDFHQWDRMIATAGVQLGRVPYAWVRHTAPGGVILAPMRADLASGPLVRFVVGGDGTAVGHATPMRVGFMELRAQRAASASQDGPAWDDVSADLSYTELSPLKPLGSDADRRWPVAVAVPSCRYDIEVKTPERSHGVAWLRDPLSQSWASVAPDGGRYAVRQFGPRRLWDEAEVAYRWWQQRGEPPLEAWEFTITPDRQSVTLPA